MRTYVGERDPATGRGRVWILEAPDRPPLQEVGQVIAELRELSDAREFRTAHAEDVLAHKHDVIERIEASERPPERRPLEHRVIHSPDGFSWGFTGSGPADLAAAILGNELAVDVPRSVYLPFRDEVIACLPDDRFELTANQVWGWVRDHRPLVDAEIFGAGPAAHAVVEAAREPTASALVSACETAWDDIRSHHQELPDVVVVLGSGVERGRLVKLGHWWGGRWIADGKVRGEMLLAGEALHLPPAQVFEVLLHEAAHGINAARGIKDTSRGGRYHNERFAATAREVGLKVSALPPYGPARTAITPDTADRYSETIERLGEAMRIARQVEGVRLGRDGQKVERQEGQSRGSLAATCGCGRKLRMAPSVLARGPVLCGLCETEFAVGAELERSEVVDETFVDRRRAALEAELIRDPRVDRWLEHLGTLHDEPMVARDPDDARALTLAARAALQAEGVLRGPPLDLGSWEVQEGERVVAALPIRDGPEPGTPGVVVSVDPRARTCRVDFSTWGTVDVEPGSEFARAFTYDYAQTGPSVAPAPTVAAAELDLQPQTPEVEW